MIIKLGLTLLLPLIFSASLIAKKVRYEFDIDYKVVNITGSLVKTMAIGGSIPAPTIAATVGDILEVTFHNKMKVETSVHWHGILLPNDQDGVPYLTTPPILAGTSFTYKFPITHAGTYWYHSHTGFQEESGLYGALVFYPSHKHKTHIREEVLVLSEWTDEKPTQVFANLKKDGDYYALKKNSVQSWLKVFQHGYSAIENRIYGAWTKMGPMDISDVGYDAFLINGQRKQHIPDVKKGDQLRLRIINASSSSYFYIQYSGGDMKVISADGIDVQPFLAKDIRIAIAETYDVLITIPEDKSYEFRASSEDGTGYGSTIFGTGPLVPSEDYPRPNLFIDHSHHQQSSKDRSKHGHMNHSTPSQSSMHMPVKEHAKVNKDESMTKDKMPDEHAHMNHKINKDHKKHLIPKTPQMNHPAHHKMVKEQSISHAGRVRDYDFLKSLKPTAFNENNQVRTIELNLTGNMERYVWSFNNKTLSEADKIMIKKNEVVKFILKNQTMMHHPVHLHGHFFRVLNKHKTYSPLKHTVNVPAMDQVIIEFLANADKDWFFHCHNL